MDCKQIIFTKPNTAEFLTVELGPLKPGSVRLQKSPP